MNLCMYPFNQIFAKNTADVKLLLSLKHTAHIRLTHSTFLVMHKLLVDV